MFKIFASITVGIVVMLMFSGMTGSYIQAQTNQTTSIDEGVLAASGNNTESRTASGDDIFVIVCPEGWTQTSECQLFNTVPARR